MNGINGVKGIGPNGNSIFLPAAGRCIGKIGNTGYYGYYWSSSHNTDNPHCAWILYFGSGDVLRSVDYRFYGFSIRPVYSE